MAAASRPHGDRNPGPWPDGHRGSGDGGGGGGGGGRVGGGGPPQILDSNTGLLYNAVGGLYFGTVVPGEGRQHAAHVDLEDRPDRGEV